MLNETNQSQNNICYVIQLNKIYKKIIKHIKTEGRMVLTRGRGNGKWGVAFQLVCSFDSEK